MAQSYFQTFMDMWADFQNLYGPEECKSVEKEQTKVPYHFSLEKRGEYLLGATRTIRCLEDDDLHAVIDMLQEEVRRRNAFKARRQIVPPPHGCDRHSQDPDDWIFEFTNIED